MPANHLSDDDDDDDDDDDGVWRPLRRTILNRTCGTHKKLYMSRLLLTIFGPI